MEESPTEDAQTRPPLSDIDLRGLYVGGLKAKRDGDLEKAGELWQQILDHNRHYLNGLVESDMDALQNQLLPIRVKTLVEAADTARNTGAWEQEVQSLQTLISLEPSNSDWVKRLKSATQNRDNSELYEVVRELIAEGAIPEARTRLELLWNTAPTFGDPSALGPQANFTHEDFQRLAEIQAQRIRKMLAEAQQELELAKAQRMRDLVAWERKTRRRRLTKSGHGDPPVALLLYYFCLLVCLVVVFSTLANRVAIPRDVTLPFHLSQLVVVAILLVLTSLVFYFAAFSATLPPAAFVPVIVASLGLGELFLQVKWSLVNPFVHAFTFPFWGRTTTSVNSVLALLACEAILAAIIALLIGLVVAVGLRVLKIRRAVKSPIGPLLLYCEVITVSYVIVANIVGVTLGYVVAGLVIGLLTALAVIIRFADTHKYFFWVILPAALLLSLLIRFVMSPVFDLSDVAASWLAVSLFYGLLFGFGAGKTLVSLLLAIRYFSRLRRKKREGFEALSLLVGYLASLPPELTREQLEELKPRI